MTIQVKRTKIFMPSLYLASLYEADREAVFGVAIVFGPAEVRFLVTLCYENEKYIQLHDLY